MKKGRSVIVAAVLVETEDRKMGKSRTMVPICCVDKRCKTRKAVHDLLDTLLDEHGVKP